MDLDIRGASQENLQVESVALVVGVTEELCCTNRYMIHCTDLNTNHWEVTIAGVALVVGATEELCCTNRYMIHCANLSQSIGGYYYCRSSSCGRCDGGALLHNPS